VVEKDLLKSLKSRYLDLNPSAVRRTLLSSGSVIEEIQILGSSPLLSEVKEEAVWLSVLEAEPLLARAKLQAEEDRYLSRRVTRLPANRANIALADLTAEEMRILRMTQKAYNAFRGPQG